MSNIPAVKTLLESFEKLLTGQPSMLLETWYQREQDALDALREKTTKSNDVASLKEATGEWLELSGMLKRLLNFDRDAHVPGFIEKACTEWWDSATESQIKLKCGAGEAYRAMATYVVAQLEFRRRDRGAALRWASLGYLADKLGEGKKGGGNEVTLRFGLGVPEEALDLLDEQARGANKRIGVEQLPEWLLAEALDDPRGVALVAPSEHYSYHPSCPFVKAAAEHALAGISSPEEKGKRLEGLTAFLVSTVPGMRPRRRLVASGTTAEHDILATAFGETPYPLPARASEWLIECKNWTEEVSVEKVGHFLAKMQHSGAKMGIVIAKAGVTQAEGKTSHAFADRFRTEFAMREGLVCLVLDADNLRQLGKRGTFRGLIDKRYEESRFGC